MVAVELSWDVLVLSLSGIEDVGRPVPNALVTLVVWSLVGNVDVVVLSLSGFETDVLFVPETLGTLKVSSLVGVPVVRVLSLPVIEAAVLFVLLEVAVVLSLSGSADVDFLSLSGNEVVKLSLLGTMGITETNTAVTEDKEDRTGTTETVVLT